MADFNKNMADSLVSELGGLLGQVQNLMNSIPDEAKAIIPTAQMDVSMIRQKMADGDGNAISDVLNKYSNPNMFKHQKK